MTNDQQTIPTLEEFRSSRQTYSWPKCAELLKIEEKWTDAPKARVYLDRFFIEDYIEEGFEHELGQRGRYVLVIERDVHYLDNLKFGEELLYNYCKNEELF